MQESRDAEPGVKKTMQDGEDAMGKQGEGHLHPRPGKKAQRRGKNKIVYKMKQGKVVTE